MSLNLTQMLHLENVEDALFLIYWCWNVVYKWGLDQCMNDTWQIQGENVVFWEQTTHCLAPWLHFTRPCIGQAYVSFHSGIPQFWGALTL